MTAASSAPRPATRRIVLGIALLGLAPALLGLASAPARADDDHGRGRGERERQEHEWREHRWHEHRQVYRDDGARYVYAPPPVVYGPPPGPPGLNFVFPLHFH